MRVSAGYEPNIGVEAVFLKFQVQSVQFRLDFEFILFPADQAHIDCVVS
jgi:hypothetical protein